MPAFLALAFVTALGVGLFLSAVNVRYRDVPYAIPFVMQMWMWLSPVALRGHGAARAVPVGLRAEPDDRRDQRLPLGAARDAGAAARAAGAERRRRASSSSSAASPTSAGPSRSSRTRSDERPRSPPTGSRSATGSASSRRATGRCATRSRGLVGEGRRASIAAARRSGRSATSRFEVARGRGRSALIGRNGAGKSTLLKCSRGSPRRPRAGRDPRPRRQPARGRHRLPPRADRAARTSTSTAPCSA